MGKFKETYKDQFTPWDAGCSLVALDASMEFSRLKMMAQKRFEVTGVKVWMPKFTAVTLMEIEKRSVEVADLWIYNMKMQPK